MKKLLAALLVIALPAPALAELKHVPKWEMVDGKACYDQEGAMSLLKLDEEFAHNLKLNKLYLLQIDQLRLRTTSLEKVIALSKTETTEWQVRSNHLEEILRTKVRELEDERVKHDTSFGIYAAGAAGLIIVSVLSTVYIAERRKQFEQQP